MSFAPVVLVVRGTEVRLHGSFVLLAVAAGIAGHRAGGGKAALWSAASVLVGIAVVLHAELGRRLLLGSQGIATREVWLTPLGGVVRVSRNVESVAERLALAFGSVPGALTVALAAGAILAGKGGILPPPWAPLRGRLVGELFWMGAGLALLQLLPLVPFGVARFFLHRREAAASLPERLARASVLARLAGLILVPVGLLSVASIGVAGALLYGAASLEQRVGARGTARITGRFGQQY